MPGKSKKNSGQTKGKKAYLPREIKDEVIKDIGTILRERADGTNSWIKDRCTTFSESDRNHLSAFVAYLNEEYPPSCELRQSCNDEDITKAQIYTWIQTVRSRVKSYNAKFANVPGWVDIDPPDHLKDREPTQAEKDEARKQRKTEKDRVDAAVLRKLLSP